MKRPLAYITAPWSNSQYENAENAAAYCRQVYDAGYSPICPVLFLPTVLQQWTQHLGTFFSGLAFHTAAREKGRGCMT